MSTTADFIAKWEGVRLEPYFDVAGYPTIGVGHKLSNEKHADLSQWQPITREQALAQLDNHLEHFRAGVHRLITRTPVGGQETALVSFAFNLGLGALERSDLRKMINSMEWNANDAVLVVLEWLSWCKATIDGKKRVVDGLLNRRRAEVALFFGA